MVVVRIVSVLTVFGSHHSQMERHVARTQILHATWPQLLISPEVHARLNAAPNAELVTAGIQEVRAHSIVSRDGVERPTDTIILATGFHVPDLPIAEKIAGRDGRTLAQVWADGMVTNRSTTVAGFPNLFLLVGPNVGVGHTSMTATLPLNRTCTDAT